MADATIPEDLRHSGPASDAQRRAALDAVVAEYARQGWTPTVLSSTQAVLQRKKRIGWFWNLLLALLTAGLWLIVVAIRVVNRKMQTTILTVDEWGRVTVS